VLERIGEIPWFPKEVAEMVGLIGLDAVLDLEIKATENFTASYYLDEIHGIADAIEMQGGFKMIQRLLLMGELTKGRCEEWSD
jgi:hypothetical protein